MKSASRRTAALAVAAMFVFACTASPEPEPIGRNSSAVTNESLSFDAVSGFPFRSSDRQVPFAELPAMLHEALITLPGSYAALPPSYVALTPDKLDPFLDYIAQNTPAHRVAGATGRARIVHVYSDAPVHVVGNYAILPDAGDKPIDVGLFLKSGGQGGYDWSKVESFCAQSQTRCISIRRAHPQNQHVGAILLAARNVILDGANSTDGLSLVVFAETYLSGASASLDLSPATATAPPPAARHQDDDELWQLERAKQKVASGAPDAHRGLAGLYGGSFILIAYRANALSIQSNGQNGSNGAPGAHVRAICTNGLWSTKYPNIQMPFHFICDPHDHNYIAGLDYWGTPSGCENICQTPVDSDPLIPDPATGGDSQYAGPAGPQGKAGRVLLSRVTQMPECGPWSAALLDDGANAGLRTRFDVQSVFNRDCSSCSESCKRDVNVTVCNQDTYTNPSVLGCCKDSSVLTDTCLGLNGNGGVSGKSGGADLAFCLEPKYPDTDLSEYDVLGATSCRANNLGRDGEYPPGVPAWWTDAPLSVTMPRIHWAIAMRRLHPLELRRRLAVAHKRFRQGERDAARLRYAEARFLLDANQRATDAGNGKPIDCNPDGSYAPDVKEVCGLRIELERRAHYLERGENYYGYSPRYAPPASLKAGTLVGMAKDELNSARDAIDNWTLGLRLHYLDQDVVSTWSASVDNEVQALRATYDTNPNRTGSLTLALANVQAQRQAAITDISNLHNELTQVAQMLVPLEHPVTKKSFTFDDLLKFVVTKGVAIGVSALAPELAPAAVAMSDALANGLDNDFGVSGAKIFKDNDEAKKWLKDDLGAAIKDALPKSDWDAVAQGGDAQVSRALQIAGLKQQQTALLMELREASRRLGQAHREMFVLQARIDEAKATVMGLEASRARFYQNRFGLGRLDELLKAEYGEAIERTQRAGELAFLAKRAVEHDFATFGVALDGVQRNYLNDALDACGGVDADSLDLRFEEQQTFCFQMRLDKLAAVVAGASQTFPFTVAGHFQRVVPIEPSMGRVDPYAGKVYDVPVDVTLAEAQGGSPFYGGTVAHELVDFSVFVDTGAAGRTQGRAVRDTSEQLWLGPTSAAPNGLDTAQYLSFSYARSAPALDNGNVLATLFASKQWKEVPLLTMDVCRGSAADNANIITNGQVPPQCKLSANVNELPAWRGRALLGHYIFTVAERDLVGASSLRVNFEFSAKAPQPCGARTCASPTAACGMIKDGCGGTLDCEGCPKPQTSNLPGRGCGGACCDSAVGESCLDASRSLCCGGLTSEICGSSCCDKFTQACVAGQCCPQKQACGTACCAAGTYCAAPGNCVADTLTCSGGQEVCHPWVPQGQQDTPICCPTGSSCCAGPPPVCCAAGIGTCTSARQQPPSCSWPKCASGDPRKYCSSDADCPGSFCPTVDALTCRAPCF